MDEYGNRYLSRMALTTGGTRQSVSVDPLNANTFDWQSTGFSPTNFSKR